MVSRGKCECQRNPLLLPFRRCRNERGDAAGCRFVRSPSGPGAGAGGLLCPGRADLLQDRKYIAVLVGGERKR
jgi:hypothetical protein